MTARIRLLLYRTGKPVGATSAPAQDLRRATAAGRGQTDPPGLGRVAVGVLAVLAAIGCGSSARYPACGGLTPEAEELCDGVLYERMQILSRYQEESIKTTPEGRDYAEARKRLDAAIEETPELSRRVVGALPAQLCRVRWKSQVKCLRLEQLLAHYDTDMAESIVNDVQQLYATNGLDAEEATLIECGGAAWASTDVEVARNPEIDPLSVARILGECSALAGQIAEVVWGEDGLGGFSGISGISTVTSWTLLCGEEVPSGSAAREFIDTALDAHDEYMKGCTVDGAAGLAEGGSEQAPPPPPPPPPPPDAEIEATVTSPPTVDDDGNTTVATDVAYSDGTIITTTVTTDPDGEEVSRTYHRQGPDGSTFTQKTDQADLGLSGAANRTQTTTKDAQGNTLDQVHLQFDDGRTESFGSQYLPGPDKQYSCRNGNCHELIPMDDCFDEMCRSCKAYRDYVPRSIEECLLTGSQSGECMRLAQQASCCMGSNAYNGDPRILIPDPAGELVCAAEVSAEHAESACAIACGVAEHQDCVGACLETQTYSDPRVASLSLIDVTCGPYGYSLDCPTGGERTTSELCSTPETCELPGVDPPFLECLAKHAVY